MNLVIVAAQFNTKVTDGMVAFAQDEAKKSGVNVVQVIRVPGTYEIPFPLSQWLAQKDVDAAVVLGAIEKGETLHGEVMGHVVSRLVLELSLKHHKPVGLGLIGPGATQPQMEARTEGHARAAVQAALAVFNSPTP